MIPHDLHDLVASTDLVELQGTADELAAAGHRAAALQVQRVIEAYRVAEVRVDAALEAARPVLVAVNLRQRCKIGDEEYVRRLTEAGT